MKRQIYFPIKLKNKHNLEKKNNEEPHKIQAHYFIKHKLYLVKTSCGYNNKNILTNRCTVCRIQGKC